MIYQWPALRVWPALILDSNPRHIGAEVFAHHGTTRSALDGGTPFFRDSAIPPFGNGWRFNSAHEGDLVRSPEFVNDGICRHAAYGKGYLTGVSRKKLGNPFFMAK